MATIEELEISGIRSFSPDFPQAIKFEHPLTLLVGPNGAGKSTVIECLQYAATGKQPKNTKKGAAFVHDLKLVDGNTVNAKVYLRFRKLLHGVTRDVTRNLRVTKDRRTGKPKLETVENEVKKQSQGNKSHLTPKCVDMKEEIVSFLGVSDAVLDNVIFCHQEEANWPLGDDRSLKEKFDDIFEVTRYTKALDKIRKSQKNQNILADEEAKNLMVFEAICADAQARSERLEKKEEKLRNANDEIRKANDQITKITPEMLKLDDIMVKINDLNFQLEGKNSRKDQMVEERKRLEKQVDRCFLGTDPQLKCEMRKVKDDLKDLEKFLQDSEKQIVRLQEEIDNYSQEQKSLQISEEILKAELKAYDETRQEREKLIKSLSDTYNLKMGDLRSEDLTDEKIGVLVSDLKGIVEREEEKIESLTIMKYLLNLRYKTEQDGLGDLRQHLDEAYEDAVGVELNANLEGLNKDVEELFSKSNTLKMTMNGPDSEAYKVQGSTAIRAKIEVLREGLRRKEAMIASMKQKRDETQEELGLSCDEALPDKLLLEKWLEESESETNSLQQTLNDTRYKTAAIESKRECIEQKIQKNHQKANVLSDYLPQDFDTNLVHLEAEIKELKERNDMTKGMKFLFKNFQEELKASGGFDHTKAMCPLCRRFFENVPVLDQFASNLHRKVESMASNLGSNKQELDAKETRYKKMISSRRKKEKIMKKLMDLQHTSNHLAEQIKIQKAETDKLKNRMTAVRNRQRLAKKYLIDSALLKHEQEELRQTTYQIQCLESQTASMSSKSTGEFAASKKEADPSLAQAFQEMKDKIEKINGSFATIIGAKDQVIALQRQMLIKMEENRLISEKNRLKEEINKKMKESEELQGQKLSAAHEREKCRHGASQKIYEIQSVIQKIQGWKEELRVNCQKETDRKRKTKQVEEIEKTITALKNEKNRLLQNIPLKRKDLDDGRMRLQDLEKSDEIRKRRKEIENEEKQIADIKRKKIELDEGGVERKLRTLQMENDASIRKKQNEIGRKSALSDEVKIERKELNQKKYKEADKNYKNSMINSMIHRRVSDDLGKFWKALDSAILQIHETKMKEINRIIKELWCRTYRGKDIECIEICSEEDPSNKSSRRVFSYKVMMHVGGAAMDMRGRCSAGQKVLASLVIRLALAETFCLNCGFLALDEPTTNLDRENIESLGEALVNIISSRSQQRNFQLMVITHDEDFVEQLGRSNCADYFYRVSKNEKGKSCLDRCRIQDLRS